MAANCELLTEFLEVAIHVILCERRVYPEAIFTSQRAFGVPVKMSRHPEVNDYISTALRDARPLLDADAVENVVVVVADGRGATVERFVFALGGPRADAACRVDVDAVEATEYAMRGLLAKLALAGTQLPPPPPNAAFRLLLETRDAPDVVAPFVAAPACGYVDSGGQNGRVDGATVVPVRTVETPLAAFSLHVECYGGPA